MGGVNFDYLPWRGGILKNEKRGWKYCAGVGLFKRGALALFLLNAFKVYHFYIYKLLYPLQNCYAFAGYFDYLYYFIIVIIFSCHDNFMKKGNSKLSKNEPENIP